MKDTRKIKSFEEAKAVVNRPSVDFKDFIKIKGYDFSKPLDFKEYLEKLTTTGMESSHLGTAIEIAKKMRKQGCKIYLAFNSNIISSGLRDIITYLVKNKLVHVLATTAGGIEEDLMKTFGSFALGSFDADGKVMREEKSVNMAGNILIPDNIYCSFEDWLKPILKEVYENQKKTNKVISTNEFISLLGEKIDNDSSYLYWAHKNQIPVFCPAIVDGAIGDQIAFFKYENKDFYLDTSQDVFKLNESTIKSEKTAEPSVLLLKNKYKPGISPGN